MSQLTHATRTALTHDTGSTIPDSPRANAAAQQWAERRQRSLERLEQDVKVASDGVERDWMAEPILKMMGPLLHSLCDIHELLEVRLGEQDGKVVNVHGVASQTLLDTNTLKVGLQALGSKVGALDSKVGALESKVDALDSKVDNVLGVASQALFEANTLKVGLQALDSKVGALESKMEALGSNVGMLDSNVDNVHGVASEALREVNELRMEFQANHETAMNTLEQILASIRQLEYL